MAANGADGCANPEGGGIPHDKFWAIHAAVPAARGAERPVSKNRRKPTSANGIHIDDNTCTCDSVPNRYGANPYATPARNAP